MMLFLRLNVTDHTRYLRFRIGKHPVPRLPLKPAATKAININPLRGIGFHILHKIADRLSGVETNKHVQVIIHAINRDHFVLTGFHNAGTSELIPSQKIPNRHTLLPFNLQFLNGQPAISGFEMQVGLAIGAVITRLGVIS